MTTLKTTVCQLCRWLADSSPTACQQLKKTVPKKRPSDTFVSTLHIHGLHICVCEFMELGAVDASKL